MRLVEILVQEGRGDEVDPGEVAPLAVVVCGGHVGHFRAQTAQGYKGGAGSERLLKGSAYGKSFKPTARTAREDWPMYRADAARRGSLPTALPAKPALKWSADFGGRLSQVVAAGGRLYVVEKDKHRICCLDRKTGRVLWRYTTGGRIDSAPTCAAGRLGLHA